MTNYQCLFVHAEHSDLKSYGIMKHLSIIMIAFVFMTLYDFVH